MLTLLNESQEVHRSLCARVSLLGLLLPHKRAKELDTGEGTLCQYLHSLTQHHVERASPPQALPVPRRLR